MEPPFVIYRYLIALGSNRRHVRLGLPPRILAHAAAQLQDLGMKVVQLSPLIASRPLGPSQRTYANAAAIVETAWEPAALLDQLKALERAFGRREHGRRWSARVLDLDIILWSDGHFQNRRPALTIPHMAFRERRFVLNPAAKIAGNWRDPLTGLTVRQLCYRLTTAKPLDPGQKRD